MNKCIYLSHVQNHTEDVASGHQRKEMCQLGDALYVEIIVAAVTMSTADQQTKITITKASKLIEQHFSAAAAFGFKTGNS